jgi:hypothetical protein
MVTFNNRSKNLIPCRTIVAMATKRKKTLNNFFSKTQRARA